MKLEREKEGEGDRSKRRRQEQREKERHNWNLTERNKCVFKKPRALQNPSQWAVNMRQADHSVQKQSKYELRDVNANTDIPEKPEK